MRLPLLFALLLALSACAAAPPPPPPAAALPAAFPVLAGTPAGPLPDLDGMFRDARLRRIIDLALDHNRDLRLALLDVEVARLQSRLQVAGTRPELEAQATYSRDQAPGTRGEAATVTGQQGLSLGLNAFEIDLFGRAHAMTEAAFARYLASGEGYRAARAALIGAVADAYIAERLAVEQQALAERTLADWRQSLDLARQRRHSGTGGEVDVIRAEAQVSAAEADLNARERAVLRAANALRLVVGADLPADLPPFLTLDADPVTLRLPAGLPSDLLLNRPDIRQAERTLAAAEADISAARAAFFPRLSLTAAFGFASPALGSLFTADHQSWNFTPRLVLPLFNGGRLQGELDLAKVRRNEAVARYEKTVQTAFREVADGLAGSATLGAQIEAQQRTVADMARAVTLAQARYRAGLDSRLELLDAQRDLQAAVQALLTLQAESVSNAVALYKALGGGSGSGADGLMAASRAGSAGHEGREPPG